MDAHRPNAAWRMIAQPHTTTADDIASVFFDETTLRDWNSDMVSRPCSVCLQH